MREILISSDAAADDDDDDGGGDDDDDDDVDGGGGGGGGGDDHDVLDIDNADDGGWSSTGVKHQGTPCSLAHPWQEDFRDAPLSWAESLWKFRTGLKNDHSYRWAIRLANWP